MKQTMIIVGTLLAVVLCIASCGGNSNTSTNKEVNVPTEYCEKLVKLAENGDAEAQANLGWCYANGEGVSQNIDEGIKWIKKSAEQNNAKGQFFLSLAYDYGRGVPQDYNEAFRLMMASANQGYAKAQSNIGGMYEYGYKDIPKDHVEAMKWFRKAAEQGEPDAQWEIASDYYFNGNYSEAVKWLEKSAAQGKDGALYSLGLCYYEGKGVKQDMNKGYNLIKQAAEKGNSNAKELLGIIGNDF